MDRVLVTGASGFLGRTTLEPLVRRGFRVEAVSSDEEHIRRLAAEAPPQVRWHRCDLLDPEATRRLVEGLRPARLLHLAWHMGEGDWAAAGAARYVHWVQASLELLRAFAGAGGRRIVVAGSCTEYDWRYGYCSEELTPQRPASGYGTCKDALRRVLASFAAETGLSQAWGRVFFAYGPHEASSRFVPSVIRALLSDRPARCSHGRQVRDYLHSRDIGSAFVALLCSDVEGAVNVASGSGVALGEIAVRLARLLEREELLELGALAVPPGSPHAAPIVLADVGRLTREVGWEPSIGLETGLSETVRWWQAAYGRAEVGA